MCKRISTLSQRLPDQKAESARQRSLAEAVNHTAEGSWSGADMDAHLVQSIQGAFQCVYVRPFKALHAGWNKLRPCFQGAQPDYDCYTCTHSLP